MNLLFPAIVLTASLCAGSSAGETVAAIALYNPTGYRGPIMTEVPTGRIAVPGLVDWARARLMAGDEEVPFAIREGRAHWRARLTAPGNAPAPEDLLVFWRAVPPGEWVRVRIVSGTRRQESAVTRTGGAIRIGYDNVEAVLDEPTGLLTALRLRGESVLDGPMTAMSHAIGAGGYVISGHVGAGYLSHNVAFEKVEGRPFTAQLASLESTETMTEARFVLELDGAPAMAVTYRVHAGGLVEITADERPWTGQSPWCDHCATFSLPMTGDWESFPCLEDRLPFYGFKDHAAVVKQTACHRTFGQTAVIALGEEVVNGRRWQRRIMACPTDAVADGLAIMDEGLVADVHPLTVVAPEGPVRISFPEEAATVAGLLKDALINRGIDVPAQPPESSAEIRLVLIGPSEVQTIEPDGFEIRPARAHGLTLRATTLLGLYRAVKTVEKHGELHGPGAGLPLVAGNPVVPFRGGGFGGGNFEVDFPYGPDEEWETVFDRLLDSGMNMFWCLGMWGNWKLPVEYAYMPEIRSDSADAYDESSGTLFAELADQRDHGLKLMKYLQDRGGKVYIWLPIGSFGWEPTATPNSFRFQWGAETFGRKNALAFVGVSDVYEQLWEINARFMLPGAWMKLTPTERERVSAETMTLLTAYGQRLKDLKQAVSEQEHARWFGHMELFAPFLEYNLRRLLRFSEIHAIVKARHTDVENGVPLPETERAALLAKWTEVYDWAEIFGVALHNTPGDMLTHCRHFNLPNHEWMSGWDVWLDPQLARPQFAGLLIVSPVKSKAGEPFTLRVEIVNTGVCPWVERAVHRLELSGPTKKLTLPASWTLTGDPVAPGDTRIVELTGRAPAEAGQSEVTLKLFNTSRPPAMFTETTVSIEWN